jgi:phospholipid-transporting ATPase
LKYKQKLEKQDKQKLLTEYRDVKLSNPEPFFPTNSISTTKYTLYNFVFVNLYEQFSKIANLYFLFLAMLQMVKIVSITNGIPTILPPLAFIVFLTMVKDVFEDYKRYKSDLEENNKDTIVYKNKKPVDTKWQDLRVGDIVRVSKNQFIPADLVLLASSDFRKGLAFVETKNLDGETNLKSKLIAEELKGEIFAADDVFKLSGDFMNAEGPNLYLYSFKGSLTHKGMKIPFNANNFLLRGCILRNTEYVIGVVAYTGHQTKVMLNSIRARPKKSTLEVDTGRSVLVTFAILISICLSAGTIYGLWDQMNTTTLVNYIYPVSQGFFHNFITRMGNWILIFGNFVPISLMLTLETVKFFQGSLMSIDKGLIASSGIECKVQSSNLNEELGQIDYVFSDKTGTLTCNEMRFKYLMVGDQVYGKQRGYAGNMPDVKNVDFDDPAVWKSTESGFATEDCKRLQEAIMLLGLCHSVVLENNGDYNASSPDELAFVYFAKLVGCEYKGMDEDNYMLMSEFGTIQKYRMLEMIEFNSDRKRMSCVVQTPDGKVILYTKGADSIMIPRYHQDRKHQFDKLMQRVEEFASVGLRTLLLGKRVLTAAEYQQFKTEYDRAKNDLNNREKAMDDVENRWERELTLVGATAIEDRLQDEVRKFGINPQLRRLNT